jgi:mono/diheme cytochrome c family protein
MRLTFAALLAALPLTALAAGPDADADAGLDAFVRSDLGGGTGAFDRHLLWALLGVAPDLVGDSESAFFARYGFIPDPDSEDHLPYGLTAHRDWLGIPKLQVTCALCHVGRVADQVLIGAGNRELDLDRLFRDVRAAAREPRFTARAAVDAAHAEARRRHEPWHLTDTAALTSEVAALKATASAATDDPAGPGLLHAARSACARAGSDGAAAPVKLPPVWSFGERRTLGAGGELEGDLPDLLWSVATLVHGGPDGRKEAAATVAAMAAWMKDAAPPAFPGEVDLALAKRGQATFASHCASCHGTNARGDYQERFFPPSEVGTDAARATAVSVSCARALTSSLRGTTATARGAYLAPNLDGAWARAPLLHNGSVPNLALLLEPPAARPAVFFTGPGVPYDMAALGDRCLRADEGGRPTCAPARAGLFRYDTRAPGRGNGGHPYGTDLPAEEKRALLEFLKTL